MFKKTINLFAFSVNKQYLSSKETIISDNKEGFSVCKYVEKILDPKGADDRVIDKWRCYNNRYTMLINGNKMKGYFFNNSFIFKENFSSNKVKIFQSIFYSKKR